MGSGYSSKLYGEDVDNAALLNLFQNNGIQMVFDSSLNFPYFPTDWKDSKGNINWSEYNNILAWIQNQPDFQTSLGAENSLIGNKSRAADKIKNLARQFYITATAHTFIEENTNTMYRWARRVDEEGNLIDGYEYRQLSGGGGDLYWES